LWHLSFDCLARWSIILMYPDSCFWDGDSWFQTKLQDEWFWKGWNGLSGYNRTENWTHFPGQMIPWPSLDVQLSSSFVFIHFAILVFVYAQPDMGVCFKNEGEGYHTYWSFGGGQWTYSIHGDIKRSWECYTYWSRWQLWCECIDVVALTDFLYSFILEILVVYRYKLFSYRGICCCPHANHCAFIFCASMILHWDLISSQHHWCNMLLIHHRITKYSDINICNGCYCAWDCMLLIIIIMMH